MRHGFTWKRIAPWAVVVLCAFTLKLYYSAASADELRWILAPTTLLVELVSAESFEFESRAGYLSSDRSFLIAPSCAGVNFLVTAFLMLSVRRLLRIRSENVGWRFIPITALIAFLATLVANALRITIALRLRHVSSESGWLDADQLHRLEGIVVYFGCLLLLFAASAAMDSENVARPFCRSLIPLLAYYATTLGIPLANGAYNQGWEFWEYSLFVLLIPVLLILPLGVLRLFIRQQQMPMEARSTSISCSSHSVSHREAQDRSTYFALYRVDTIIQPRHRATVIGEVKHKDKPQLCRR